jgi:two-component system, chemotaxis family, chemotaxis protein CheY
MSDLPRILYIIKWVKQSDKPDYQFGEFILTAENRYIPKPPQIFWNLNALYLYLKNNYSTSRVSILAMGLDNQDIGITEHFVQTNPFITTTKFLNRPSGKKPDGTPYKVFLVDDNTADLRLLKQIMLDEHFEIISMAKTPENCLNFFRTNARHIDILITEIYLTLNSMFDTIKEMKQIKPELKIIAVSRSSNKFDIQKLMSLKVDRILVKPVLRERLVEAVKQIAG